MPHYAHDLADKVERFFDRLPAGRIVTRRNWGFSPHPLLFVPDRTLRPPEGNGADDPAQAARQMWMRSERQTLRRLPNTGAILFGIKIQLAPITALAAYPEVCARLAEAMHGWTPEQVESRGGRFGVVLGCINWLNAAGSSRAS